MLSVQFDHLASDTENGAFTDIAHPVGKAFQIMRRPQQPVGALDILGVLKYKRHQLTINLIIQGIHLIIFRWDRARQTGILIDESG